MKAAEDNGRTQGKLALAFDTSNYTSSAAWFGGVEGRNSSLPLPVGRGELGLRQSEALFWHVRRLPGL
jgi:N6-L-threonylcarbamoyladenine synthase